MRLLYLILLSLYSLATYSQVEIPRALALWAENYQAPGLPENSKKKCEVKSIRHDAKTHTVVIEMNDLFASQQWTPTLPQVIYAQVRPLLPDSLRKELLQIRTLDRPIEHLAPYARLDTIQRLPAQNYLATPWVTNASQPYSFEHGLSGRHIALWASHGIYWSHKKERWEWQRPLLFDDREDLLTPKIAYELLTPMLEAAGAIVWSPRERCSSSTEIIIDNDHAPLDQYVERTGRHEWQSAGKGFAPIDTMRFGDNPFTRGTARVCRGQNSTNELTSVTWYVNPPKSERLAVYVSYCSMPGSTTDAHYTIRHAGIETLITVNQTMGGSTWVYLGEYLFAADDPQNNCVILTNQTKDGGFVSADAVRLGGGMGNALRGDTFSGMKRCEEGARYFMQWAGMPDTIYSTYAGEDDYKDDINVRSFATNLLCGGSLYNPEQEGLKVPLEMSIAVHTDAGIKTDGIVGSLGIATTRTSDGRLATGCSRLLSRDLAEEVLTSVTHDMPLIAGKWNRRELWDRNYSETRVPVIPSTIIEMLSHQNANDMEMIKDSSIRFHLARAIYKGVTRFIYKMHGEGHRVIIQPLPVRDINLADGIVSWKATRDPLEATAVPSHYLVQLSVGGHDFDNGTLLTTTSCRVNVPDDKSVTIRISAINAGGASLPMTYKIR